MKTATTSHLLAAALALAGMLAPLELSAQDLPYNSGSTGADGALTIPTVFPNAGPRGGAVYHEAEQAVYYISSYFVWKTTDGVTWTRMPDLPNQWAVDPASGQLCYDTVNSILYAFALRGDTTSAQLYKLVGGNWQSVGDPMPSYGGPDRWVYGRMVFHAANGTLVYYGAGNQLDATWTFNGTAWTQEAPANVPSGRKNPQMAYDPVRNETVLFGGVTTSDNNIADTWVWNGSDWTAKSPVTSPPAMNDYGAVWHPGYQGVVIPVSTRDLWVWNGTDWRLEHTTGLAAEAKGGFSAAYLASSTQLLAIANNQVISLKSGAWSAKAGTPYSIDLNTKPNGVFNYTDITVPAGVTVNFIRNAANTPVIWLASGNVTINGTVNVSASGYQSGPGGYDGAHDMMTIGYGPGGGSGSTNWGGRYYGVYGNPQIEPLVGGSGGGKESYGYSHDGGGGGGAILIASSRDIQISGAISAIGANSPQAYFHYGYWCQENSGSGSGGAIKLVADRVKGAGELLANGASAINWPGGNGGYRDRSGNQGRIRVEAYESEIGANASPQAWWASSPVWTSASISSPQTDYEVKVTHVAGSAVRQPPTGGTSSPDVFFSTGDPVTVVVSGRNIPDGAKVKLFVSGNGINLTLPPAGDPDVLMQSGGATFNVTIPAGYGGIQASAAFERPATPP